MPGKGNMRLLAASDIHGSHDVYRWLSELVSRHHPDVLVLAGDLLGVPDGFDTLEAAQQSDADSIAAMLGSLPVPVYYVMGNDDSIELVPQTDNVRSVNVARVDHGAYNFVGYQYTLPFMGGVFERREDIIKSDLASLASLMDDRTILVTHNPAFEILDSTQLGPAGSASIRDVILARGVRVHIHGHVHSCFGRSGIHFNVASALRHRAMLIDADSMLHQVLGEAAG